MSRQIEWGETSTILGSEGQTVQAGKYRLDIGKQVRVSPSEVRRAQLLHALSKIPDVASTTEINYWVEIDHKLLYIEGWSDKCIAGWGYPKRSEEGAYETFFEVGERLTPEILQRKQKPSDNPFDKNLKILEGGWVGTPNAKKLFGITYGIYESVEQKPRAVPQSKGGKPMRILDVRGKDTSRISKIEGQYDPRYYRQISTQTPHETTDADIKEFRKRAEKEGAIVLFISNYGQSAYIPIKQVPFITRLSGEDNLLQYYKVPPSAF